MDSRHADDFTEILQALAEQYDRTISPAAQAMFFTALLPYEWETVRSALDTFVRSPQAKYGFPKPIHIIEIIEGSPEEREAHSWAVVTDACRRIGNYQSAIFEDVALARTIERMFGSWAACVEYWSGSNEMLWQSKRKEFISLYRIAQRGVLRDDPPMLLMGRTALQNAQSGYHPARQPFGVILLDGRIEIRYLHLDDRTGLPAAALRDVLALPAPTPRPLLPVGRQVAEADVEMPPGMPAEGPDRARWILKTAIEEFFKRHTFDAKAGVSSDRPDPKFGLTLDEEQRRKAAIRAQAASDAKAAKRRGRSADAVPGPEAAATGDADRDPDQGRRPADSGEGVSVREERRSRVAVRSRVAGVENRPGDRGRKLRSPRGTR